MKITQLRVDVGRTINLGNYNSLKIEQGVTVDLEDGDTIEDARAAAFDEIKHGLMEQNAKFNPKSKAAKKSGGEMI